MYHDDFLVTFTGNVSIGLGEGSREKFYLNSGSLSRDVWKVWNPMPYDCKAHTFTVTVDGESQGGEIRFYIVKNGSIVKDSLITGMDKTFTVARKVDIDFTKKNSVSVCVDVLKDQTDVFVAASIYCERL